MQSCRVPLFAYRKVDLNPVSLLGKSTTPGFKSKKRNVPLRTWWFPAIRFLSFLDLFSCLVGPFRPLFAGDLRTTATLRLNHWLKMLVVFSPCWY